MKNLWVHGFYLLIIGVLGFMLWLKSIGVKEISNETEMLFRTNTKISEDNVNQLNDAILQHCFKRPSRNKEYEGYVQNFMNSGKQATSIINLRLADIWNKREIDIDTIKDCLKRFSIQSLEIKDKRDSLALSKLFLVDNILEDKIFWTFFKQRPVLSCNILKNAIALDKINYLNYMLDKVSGYMGWFGNVRNIVAICPKKLPIYEGDILEADIHLATYNTDENQGITMTVNGEEIPFRYGVAHYSKRVKSAGSKILNVLASMRNPATGEITRLGNTFEYKTLIKLQ